MPHCSSAHLIVLYILVDTKSHSYRIGGACHAAEVGYSDDQIRALGRWKSDGFKVYLSSEVLYRK